MCKQFRLNLLGEFAVYRDMEPLVLPPSCRRLVALAAVKRRELHRSWVCDVGGDGDNATAMLFDPVSRAVQVIIGTRQQRDVCAFASQGFGTGQTYSGCGSGDQGDAVGHVGHGDPPM